MLAFLDIESTNFFKKFHEEYNNKTTEAINIIRELSINKKTSDEWKFRTSQDLFNEINGTLSNIESHLRSLTSENVE